MQQYVERRKGIVKDVIYTTYSTSFSGASIAVLNLYFKLNLNLL
jgi:hypothetical protein